MCDVVGGHWQESSSSQTYLTVQNIALKKYLVWNGMRLSYYSIWQYLLHVGCAIGTHGAATKPLASKATRKSILPTSCTKKPYRYKSKTIVLVTETTMHTMKNPGYALY